MPACLPAFKEVYCGNLKMIPFETVLTVRGKVAGTVSIGIINHRS